MDEHQFWRKENPRNSRDKIREIDMISAKLFVEPFRSWSVTNFISTFIKFYQFYVLFGMKYPALARLEEMTLIGKPCEKMKKMKRIEVYMNQGFPTV